MTPAQPTEPAPDARNVVGGTAEHGGDSEASTGRVAESFADRMAQRSLDAVQHETWKAKQ